MAVLRLTTVADGVNVDIKDLLTYEVDNTSMPDKRPVNGGMPMFTCLVTYQIITS